MVRSLSVTFGLLIGAMWMGEVLMGNLGDTSVLGHLRTNHPAAYAKAGYFVLAVLALTALAGVVAAYRTGSIGAALQVGVWSGLISGGITLVTLISMTALFHDALMQAPSNLVEFARASHGQAGSAAAFSQFLYWDALGGGLNHLWIGPLLGVTLGGAGALVGKDLRSR